MTNKMTKREKFEMIIAEFTKAELTEDTAMLVDFCNAEIEALDRKAEKARERKAAKAEKEDSLMEDIVAFLNDVDAGEYTTIPAIIDGLGDDSLTPSKITPRLTRLIENGLVDKKSVTTADKRKLNGYALIRA